MAGGRGSKDYRKSKAKERQVVCRYCRQQTAEQNYKRHLQLLHKEEYKKNPGDLRQYGEQTLGGFLKMVDEADYRIQYGSTSGGLSC